MNTSCTFAKFKSLWFSSLFKHYNIIKTTTFYNMKLLESVNNFFQNTSEFWMQVVVFRLYSTKHRPVFRGGPVYSYGHVKINT